MSGLEMMAKAASDSCLKGSCNMAKIHFLGLLNMGLILGFSKT
jgi:hypothetical protein